ncbi:MAG TPA: S8 family serine peptidase [Candidatus Eisenbacteria bacterium]|jgi:subtilisin family serine protease
MPTIFRRAAAGLALAVLVASLARAADYAPGELLVRWKPTARASARAAALAPLGASHLKSYDFIGVERLSIPGMGVAEAVARLKLDPRVEYAEPDYIFSIDRTPNDPRYPEQYGLNNTGQTSGTAGDDISAEAAWDKFTGDPDLLIGDIDTGAEYDHPDLAANIWTNPGEIPGNGIDDDGNGWVDDVHGYDFANGDGDPRDDNGHGTHTAGTIAAVGNNGEGVTGVVWHAKIVVLKFLDSSGHGLEANAIEAISYSIRMGVKITNNSWAGGFVSRALEDAIAAAGAAGQLFIAAAGNAHIDTDAIPAYPASLPEDCIISVAATDQDDHLAPFSNFGATTVDLAAPGVNILSTVPGHGYRLLSGTSMATPHVTGAAAFLMGRFPGMAAAEVKSRLLRFATPRPDLIGRCVSGGRLNLDLAASDPDSLDPGGISDLSVVSPGSNSVDLLWTATGDDSTAGTATSYELRYATHAFTAAEFASGTLAASPRPVPSGAAQAWRVHGLATTTPYWFAVRALDEFGNPGTVSNVASTTTLPPPALVATPRSLELSALTGDTLSGSFEIANDSPGTLEWSSPPPAFEAGAAQAVWPAVQAAKGEDGPSRGPQLASSGGPDAFGYRWTDSAEPGGPEFSWADVARPANAVALTGDEAVSAPVPLGFSFPYYGHRFTELRVCTNGYLQFGNDDPLFANSGLPTFGGARNMIAPFWDDLNFGAGVNRAYAHFDGSRFVVSWVGVPRYNDLGSLMTFQVILFPTGEIRFQYLRMTGNDGNGSIGIQDSTRTVGLLVAFDQPFVHDSLAVRIVPVRQWLALVPTQGFLAPGAHQRVGLALDASGLGSGSYHAVARLVSNAPAGADTSVAVSLAVSGAPSLLVSPPALEFGAHFTGAHDTLGVTVANAGVDSLHILGVTSDRPQFTVPGAAFTLLPGDARTLPVAYTPDAITDHRGVLSISSDDPRRPLVTVTLHGVGSASPEIVAVQAQLQAATAPELRPDAAQRSRPLVLRNQGGAPLVWTASAYQGLIGARPQPVANAIAVVPQIKNTVGPGVGAAGNGGPDAFGYRYVDSDAPDGPAFAWEEIETSGVRLFGSADDSTTRVALPFPFTFYGRAYDSVSVCTNGWLSFTSRDSSLVNTDLPDSALGVPRALVAPYWTDLDLRSVRGPGRAYAAYDGSKFVVEWKDAVHFSGTSPYTFQVFLWPSGEIEFQYRAFPELPNPATIGLQDETGTIGLRVAYNVPYAHPGLRVRLSHQDDWLKLDRTAGSIPPGGTDTLHVTFDAREYKDGNYAGEVRIVSNDADLPLLVVPSAMHVGVLRDTTEALPGVVGAVSLAPLVRFALTPPAPDAALLPASLQLNGLLVRPVGAPTHATDGRLAVAVRAVDVLAGVPAGEAQVVTLTGEFDAGGWFAAGTRVSVIAPAIVGGPLPAFGSPLPTRMFRGNDAVDLAWIPPPGGPDSYDVAYSRDGGVRWNVVAHGTQPVFEFLPGDTTFQALLEVVARHGDVVLGTWLSAPFVVDLEVVGVSGEPPPRRFALRMAGSSPAFGSVRLALDQPAARIAVVEVYDIRGARVRTLVRGALVPGRHPLAWDGRRDDGGPAAPGIYLVRARSGPDSHTLRVAFLR